MGVRTLEEPEPLLGSALNRYEHTTMCAMGFCRQLTSKNDLLNPNRKLVWDRWDSFKLLSKSSSKKQTAGQFLITKLAGPLGLA